MEQNQFPICESCGLNIVYTWKWKLSEVLFWNDWMSIHFEKPGVHILKIYKHPWKNK